MRGRGEEVFGRGEIFLRERDCYFFFIFSKNVSQWATGPRASFFWSSSSPLDHHWFFFFLCFAPSPVVWNWLSLLRPHPISSFWSSSSPLDHHLFFFFFTLLCSLSNGVKQLNAKSIDVTPLHLSINECDPLNDFQGLKFRALEKESLEGRDQNGMIDTSAVCTVQGDIQKATMVFFKKTYPLEA